MKTWLVILAAAIIGCGGGDKPATDNQPPPAEQSKPANPKGYGRITEVKVGPIDHAMATKGLDIFDTKCMACHKLDVRYVGPPLRKVTERRTPEFVMNMILDSEIMVEKDDTVKCLLQEYLLKMPNQHVDEADARNVLEYLRLAATAPAGDATKHDGEKDDDEKKDKK